MTKTGQQIEDDVYALITNSPLSKFIGGTVYKFGMRPMNSTKEDAVVKFVVGIDGQIQTGSLVVNIYIPDIDSSGSEILVRDIARLTEIESAAKDWVYSLSAADSDYIFSLAATIQSFEEPQIHQHFVSVRLEYKLSTL